MPSTTYNTACKHIFLSISMLLLALAVQAQQPTKLIVRALAKDAKFIGSSIGGAYVVVRDAVTHKILAEGFTEGSTGSTDRIMKEPQERHKQLTDEATAKFETTLRLEKPVFVTVEVWAPYNQPGARVQAQTQLWLLPGKDIAGDGPVLEVPGFVVSALSPQLHEAVPAGKPLSVKANVVMMCGCPLTKGGLWNADNYQVEALVYRGGKLVATVPLQQQDKESTFIGTYTPQEAGMYELNITAFDSKTGNTGLDKVNFLVK